MTDPIDRYMPNTGRYLKENGKLINIADLAERIDRLLTPINGIQVAEPFPVISLKSNYGLSDIRDIVATTGSGTVTNSVGDGRYAINTGTTAGSTAELQSVERGRYVSGTISEMGLGIKAPPVLTSDQEACWGYFDADDGLGFGEDVDGLFIFRRYEGVDTKVYRENWEDRLDGTGPSGLTIDQSNVDIYQIAYRWYGSGPAVFKISGRGTRSDTIQVYVFEAPDGQPIIKDPNLPINATISNGSTSEDIGLEVYGRQYAVLGTYAPNRRITSEYRLDQSVSTTFVPLITFQQKTAFSSVSVKTSGVSILASSESIIWQIRVGGTVDGTYEDPQNVPATETSVEFSIDGTTITGGQALYTGVAGAGGGNKTDATTGDIPDVDLPVGTPITLCARTVSGNATVTSVFRAREEW